MKPGHLRRIAMYAVTLLVLACLLAPLLLVLPVSFSAGSTLSLPVPGYSLRWYHELVQDGRWLQALRVSLTVGLSATGLAVILGVPAAIGLAWGRFPGRALAAALLAVPIVIPIVIFGVAAYFLFARLGLIGSLWSLILSHTALALPVVIATVLAQLRGFDRSLLRASASLGAGPLRTFAQVLLPLIAPGILSGALIGFTLSFDEVVLAAYLTAGDSRSLPRLLLSGVRENISPVVAAVAVVLMAGSALLLALYAWLRRR